MSEQLASVQGAVLRLEFGRNGSFRVLADSAERIAGCVSRVVLAGGEVTESRESGFQDASERAFQDRHGSGRMIELVSAARGLRLRLEVAVYADQSFALLRLGVTNERSSTVALESLSPLSGEPVLPGTPRGWRFYRHGWQGTTPAVSLPALGRELGGLIGPPVHAPEQPPSGRGQYYSDDIAVLTDTATGASQALGFVTARDHLSQVRLDAGRLLDALCLGDGVPLAPGETRWSERLLVDAAGTANEQLGRYGDALAREMDARVKVPTPDGWCTWYRYFWNITEEISLANLRVAAEHRERLPFTYFQVDDGYQAGIGDWTTINEKFPHGMAWLAQEIRSAGFIPGLWLAPLFSGARSQLYAEHPDWVVQDGEGRPVMAMRNWDQDCYGLDGTNPDVRRWLTDLFREVCDGWGYDYVKTDFLFGGAVKGRRADMTKTRAQAYRMGLDAIRQGTGPDRFILGCLALNAPSVGFCDSARIGPDVAPWWRWLTQEQRADAAAGKLPPPYHPDGVPQTLANILNTLTRSWMQGRIWANDPDCLVARGTHSALSLEEVRTLATVIGLSGGTMFDSDDLTDLADDRIDIISAVLPPLPAPATPTDLMDHTFPSLYEMDVERPFGRWRLSAAINLEDRPRNVRVPLPRGRWHAFDFWGRRYLGKFEDEIIIRRLAPHASRLLRLTPVSTGPTVIGSTFHLGQGVHELEGCAWDAGSRTLRLSLRQMALAGGSLFLSAPAAAGQPQLQGAGRLRRAAGGAWELRLSLDRPRQVDLSFA